MYKSILLLYTNADQVNADHFDYTTHQGLCFWGLVNGSFIYPKSKLLSERRF